jgi:hypothetical protein
LSPEIAFLIHFFISSRPASRALAAVYDYRVGGEERPKPIVLMSIFHSEKIGDRWR